MARKAGLTLAHLQPRQNEIEKSPLPGLETWACMLCFIDLPRRGSNGFHMVEVRIPFSKSPGRFIRGQIRTEPLAHKLQLVQQHKCRDKGSLAPKFGQRLTGWSFHLRELSGLTSRNSDWCSPISDFRTFPYPLIKLSWVEYFPWHMH
ncbi:hypothetical protein VNO77_39422 [Canavalia gladiata]|uniref:Uncharacterized protein n=1 Tax=Canavalia gladiata TaxID=3824 RepID=A0AAN9PY81_CANGL